MNIIFIAAWSLVGLWSFIITQNIIKGWDYIKQQQFPSFYFVSAMLMGPISTLTCIYTLSRYYKSKNEVKK